MRTRWVRAILRRDLLLLRDAPWTAVLSMASTVLGVQVFGLLGRFVGHGTNYVTLVLSGITFLRVVDAVVQAPGHGLREERSRGSLEVLVDAPQRTWALVLVSGLVPALRSLVEGVLALSLAGVLFHADIKPGLRGLVAVPAAVLALLVLALASGLFLAAASMQSRAATAASTFFGLAVALTAGVYYPRTQLPAWVRIASTGSPFTAALKGLREALTDTGNVVTSLAATAGASAVIAVAGGLLMARAVRLSRRSGSFQRG
ncbi:MAG: ABC transporter permease [Actinomycetota bacterium]|nr:ABC transporter permease [Actinomycetota bacterium]